MQHNFSEKVSVWCERNGWSDPFYQDGFYWGFNTGSVLPVPLPLPQSHESYFINQYAESIKTNPTCKFLAETFPNDFAAWLLNEPIALKTLSSKELNSEYIELDSSVFLDSGNTILHIDFHQEPDAWIPFKMIDYRLRLYHCLPQKQVRQIVVYLTPTDSELVHQNMFKDNMTQHQFEVTRLWEQPTQTFLGSKGLLPLAVLSKTSDKAQTLRQVVSQIDAIPEISVRNDLFTCTKILAELMLEKDLINQILRI